MHYRGDLSCTRGYEWWMLAQAKARNPGIKTYALSWGVPAWIGNGSYFSDDNIACVWQPPSRLPLVAAWAKQLVPRLAAGTRWRRCNAQWRRSVSRWTTSASGMVSALARHDGRTSMPGITATAPSHLFTPLLPGHPAWAQCHVLLLRCTIHHTAATGLLRGCRTAKYLPCQLRSPRPLLSIHAQSAPGARPTT